MGIEPSRAPRHLAADMAHADHQPARVRQFPEFEPAPLPASLLRTAAGERVERLDRAGQHIVGDRGPGGVAVADRGAALRQRREDRRVIARAAGLQPAQGAGMAQHAEEGAHRPAHIETGGGIGGRRIHGAPVDCGAVRAVRRPVVVDDGDIEAGKGLEAAGKALIVGPIEKQAHRGRPWIAAGCASTTPQGRPRQ